MEYSLSFLVPRPFYAPKNDLGLKELYIMWLLITIFKTKNL